MLQLIPWTDHVHHPRSYQDFHWNDGQSFDNADTFYLYSDFTKANRNCQNVLYSCFVKLLMHFTVMPPSNLSISAAGAMIYSMMTTSESADVGYKSS